MLVLKKISIRRESILVLLKKRIFPLSHFLPAWKSVNARSKLVNGTLQFFKKLHEGLIHNTTIGKIHDIFWDIGKYHEKSLNQDFFKIEIFSKSFLTNWLKVIPKRRVTDRT